MFSNKFEKRRKFFLWVDNLTKKFKTYVNYQKFVDENFILRRNNFSESMEFLTEIL